jgi:hypothetical protein
MIRNVVTKEKGTGTCPSETSAERSKMVVCNGSGVGNSECVRVDCRVDYNTILNKDVAGRCNPISTSPYKNGTSTVTFCGVPGTRTTRYALIQPLNGGKQCTEQDISNANKVTDCVLGVEQGTTADGGTWSYYSIARTDEDGCVYSSDVTNVESNSSGYVIGGTASTITKFTPNELKINGEAPVPRDHL